MNSPDNPLSARDQFNETVADAITKAVYHPLLPRPVRVALYPARVALYPILLPAKLIMTLGMDEEELHDALTKKRQASLPRPLKILKEDLLSILVETRDVMKHVFSQDGLNQALANITNNGRAGFKSILALPRSLCDTVKNTAKLSHQGIAQTPENIKDDKSNSKTSESKTSESDQK